MDVNDILDDVVTDLKSKQKAVRGDISYYTPEPIRETAAARQQKRPQIDFNVGDLVIINMNGKRHVGRVGVIIGVRYKNLERAGDALIYTVKFNAKESADYVARQLINAEK